MQDDIQSSSFLYFGAVAAVTLGIYASSLHSYLLFHALVEIFTISIAFTMVIITWNTRRFLSSGCLKVLGIGYGLIAVIDLPPYPGLQGDGLISGVRGQPPHPALDSCTLPAGHPAMPVSPFRQT